MNHFGTLSALQPVLISAGIIMHRCRRRFDDEQRYYLEDAQAGKILRVLPGRMSRRGYTLTEVLNWLYMVGQQPVSQSAHALLTQLDYTNTATA